MTDKTENTVKDYSIKSWIERSKNRDLFKNFNELPEDPAQDQVTDLVYPEYRDNAEIDRLIAGITRKALKKEKKKRVYNLFYTETCGEYDSLDNSNSSEPGDTNYNELENSINRRNYREYTRKKQNALYVSSYYQKGNKEKNKKNKNKNRSNKKLKGLSENVSNGYESFFDDDAMSLTPSPSYYYQKEEDRNPTYVSADSQMSLIDFQEETPQKIVVKEQKEGGHFFEMDENNETPIKFLTLENSEETPLRYMQLLPDETPRKFLNEKDRKNDILLHKEGSVKSTKEATSQENIPLSLSEYSSDDDNNKEFKKQGNF